MGYSSYGIQQTLDIASRFTGKAFPTYLRVQNEPEIQDEEFVQFGFQVSASGGAVTTDVLIDPPPIVTDIPLRDIGLNAAQLSFGSKKFQVSQGFVAQRQLEMGYQEPGTGLPDYYMVFRHPSVVGIYYNSRLFKIVSILPDVIGTNPTWWFLLGQFQEQPVVP